MPSESRTKFGGQGKWPSRIDPGLRCFISQWGAYVESLTKLIRRSANIPRRSPAGTDVPFSGVLVEQELEGEWWVPGENVEPRPGILHFKTEGFRLRTYGAIVRPAAPPESIFERVTDAVVWGTVYEGHKPVTLLGVSGYRPWSSEGLHVWHVGIALVGGHFDAQAAFDLVAVRTEHLDEWAGGLGVASTTAVGADGRVKAAEAKVERVVLDSAVVSDVGIVEVEGQPRGWSNEREFTVALKAQFRVHATPAVTLDEALAEAAKLRDLVRLSVGGPCAIEELEVRSAQVGDDGRPVWAKVLRRSPALMVPRPKTIDGYSMLVRRSALPGGFETGLRTWREIRERYRRAWVLLTTGDEARLRDPSGEFIAFSRAVESLHATDFGGSPAAVTERDERLERALSALPDDLVDWARPLLEASTPPYQRHRVMEVVAELGDVGVWLAGGDPEHYAAWVVGTRNFLVHPTGNAGKRVLHLDEDQFWFSMSLQWLGVAYILNRLGVTLAELDERLRRTGRASNAAAHVAAFLAQGSQGRDSPNA